MPFGIKSTGVDDEQGAKRAAGVVFVADDGDVLLLRRGGVAGTDNFVGHWALPGGGAEDGETAEEAALREVYEEIDYSPKGGALRLLSRTKTPNGFLFTTFALPVDEKFVPKLNDEHTGYAWASLDMLPKPLHPAVESVLGAHIGVGEDMQPDDWESLRTGFAKWTREEEQEPEHAADRAVLRRETFALDRKDSSGDTVRSIDADGRLHVRVSNISKACINPYLGREIPNWKALGLDPERIYRLFRDPEELKKAVSTFNNLQLLSQHKPVNAEDHSGDLTIGSTGTDAVFEFPYLKNSLVVWVQPAVDAIESGEWKELSSAYRYTADMTPGAFEGEQYDGVMRDIVGNHVALVEEGRAGPDVVVGDSAEELKMAKATIAGALTLGLINGVVAPRLAKGNNLSLASVLVALDGKNFKTQRPKIVDALKGQIDGKLRKGFALDATMDDVNNLLDKLDDGKLEAVEKSDKPEVTDDLMTEANSAVPPLEEAVDDDPIAKIKAMLEAAGVAPEIIAKIDEVTGGAAAKKEPPALGAQDDPPPFEGMPKKGGAQDEDPKKDEEKPVDAKAMDAAIKSASDETRKQVIREQNAIREAERAVRPYVGELQIACDSADKVYEHALKALGVKIDGVHPSAYPTILGMQRKVGEKEPRKALALDAKIDTEGFEARHSNASRISVIG